jgi:hypothetical protein
MSYHSLVNNTPGEAEDGEDDALFATICESTLQRSDNLRQMFAACLMKESSVRQWARWRCQHLRLLIFPCVCVRRSVVQMTVDKSLDMQTERLWGNTQKAELERMRNEHQIFVQQKRKLTRFPGVG